MSYYIRLIKLGETVLIVIYATGPNKAVDPYSISGVLIKN